MRVEKIPDLLINAFVVLVLMLAAEALFALLQPPGAAEQDPGTLDLGQGNAIVQMVWLGVYGVTLLLLLPRLKQLMYFITTDKLLLLLMIIALLSVLWSVAPDLTLRRSVALVGTTLFGTYLAMRYRPIELLQLLALALGLIALLSLMVALVLPSYGLHSDSTGVSLVGIFTEKNQLGRSMGLSGLVFIMLAFASRTRDHRIYSWVAWVGFGLSLVVLFLSNSRMPLATLLALLPMLFLFYGGFRIPYPLNISFLIGVLLASGSAVAWLLSHSESVLNVLGRDSSLSGRTDWWPAVLDAIWQRPLLGYGYGAFWRGWEGESAQVWLETMSVGFHPVHAHNGIFDLWLGVGLLGVATFAAGFSRAFVRALAWAHSTKRAEGLWPVALLILILAMQLTETSLRQNSIAWILYVYVTITLSLSNRHAVVNRTDYIEMKPSVGVEPRTIKSLSK
jgi:exopolysaccharide production protein ExoQ